MIRKALGALAGFSALALLVSGCAESAIPQATGKGDVRGINAIVASQPISFLIEERPLGTILYKGQRRASWDDLSYNFNFDLLLPGAEEASRIATSEIDVNVDTEYVIALTGSIANPSIVRWEQPLRRWQDGETTITVAFGHLAASMGAIDVYFAGTGIAPAPGAARASFAFGEFTPNIELPSGTYVITITPQNEPATIIHQSIELILASATSYLVGVFEPDAAQTSALGVRLMSGANRSVEAVDVNSAPVTRLVNAASDAGNIDLYLNEDFSAPLHANTAFREVTARVQSASGPVKLTATAAGNQGAILFELDSNINPASLTTVLFAGTAAQYTMANILDNPQGVETIANLRMTQGASNITGVDVYVFKTGDDISAVLPDFFLPGTGFSTSYVGFLEGTYELAITRTGEKTVVGSLSDLTVSNGEVAEFVIVDSADPNTLEFLRLPN